MPTTGVESVRTRVSREYKLRMGLLLSLMLLLSLPIAMTARRNGHWLFWVVGLSPLAVSVLILAPAYRRSPRVLDQEGVERRDGKRLRWDEFIEQRDISSRTGHSHTELRFRGGVVQIFPAMFDDLAGLYRFLAQRRTAKPGPPPTPPAAPVEAPSPPPPAAKGSCPTCGPLGEWSRGMQKGGREEEDTFLPAEVGNLQWVKEVRPGQNRTPELTRCPSCGDYFLYEVTYEFLVTGSEDEQILTRLSPDVARRYLDGWDGRSA